MLVTPSIASTGTNAQKPTHANAANQAKRFELLNFTIDLKSENVGESLNDGPTSTVKPGVRRQ